MSSDLGTDLKQQKHKGTVNIVHRCSLLDFDSVLDMPPDL